ncbi:hypothetical protein [Salmonella enterica]|uniref:hypothetical protein n=1 Tax=Salmonella enterica TaxID=28901 RepID=UPI000B8AA407|nr:hypothetical protein [Salmonella enterica]OXM32296.1 tail assembly chaperone [Salmonella enterica subsp. enterica serovar Weslaco]
MRAYFIPSVPTFIPESWKNDGTYTEENWPSDAVLLTEEETSEFWMVSPPDGKKLGVIDGKPAWVDIPSPPNSELRKAALAALSNTYQDDIEKLNRAWLAAAVNDGVNETAKKDVVLAQINSRKTQYANDRAAIIAQYPD